VNALRWQALLNTSPWRLPEPPRSTCFSLNGLA